MWEIEAGGNDCFIGVSDNSRFQLSNWQLTTRGDVYDSQTFSWSGGEFKETLQLGSYRNILSEGGENAC